MSSRRDDSRSGYSGGLRPAPGGAASQRSQRRGGNTSATASTVSGSSSSPARAAPGPSTSLAGPSTPIVTVPPTAAQLSLQNLRVNRRRALAPTTVTNAQPTIQGQRDRIEAMRNQLRSPHGLERAILVRHLTANSWDVNRAAEAFRREEQAVRDNHDTDWPEDYQSDPSRTVGGSRLRAGHTLRLQLRPATQTERFGRTNAEMFTLLQRNSWLVGPTSSDFLARKGDFDDIVDGLAALRVPFPNQMRRDERLAAFISLTSTDSPSAAARLLRRMGWDYARAVDEWVNLGYLPKKRSETSAGSLGSVGTDVVGRRRHIVANRHLNVDRTNQPPATSATQIPANGPSPSFSSSPGNGDSDSSSSSEQGLSDNESAVPLSDYDATSDVDPRDFTQMAKMTYGTGAKDRKGYVIDGDRSQAKPGCPDASKLRIEWIRNSQYRCKWFPGQLKVGRKEKKFRWNDEDHDSDEDKLEFNWSDKSHVSKLNRWREEEYRRITSEITKPPSSRYEDAELEFIWDKHAQWLEEEFWKKAGQEASQRTNYDSTKYHRAKRYFDNGGNLPLKVPAASVRQWAEEFNAKFAGKTVVDGHIFPAPRPSRPPGSIEIQRHRIKNLEITNAKGDKVTLSTIDDFAVKHQPAHGAKREDGTQSPQRKPGADASSEGEAGQSGDEADGEADN